MKIRTSHDWPPIPYRGFDWSAVDDDTYDGEGCPIGTGFTEAEAVADLLYQLDDLGIVWRDEVDTDGLPLDVDRLRDDRDERRRLAKEYPDSE